MDQHDADNPIQCLVRRYKYHKEMSENLIKGSGNQIFHEKMAEEFRDVIDYLKARNGE